jgi:PAS domain S-box-containing protein
LTDNVRLEKSRSLATATAGVRNPSRNLTFAAPRILREKPLFTFNSEQPRRRGAQTRDHVWHGRKITNITQAKNVINPPRLFCVVGLDGRFERVNPACEACLGWAAEDLLFRPFLDFVHPDDRAATAEEMARARVGARTVNFETRVRGKDGADRRLCWTATASSPGRAICVTARDVTGETRLERERIEACDRERERMGRELHVIGREGEIAWPIQSSSSRNRRSTLGGPRRNRSDRRFERPASREPLAAAHRRVACVGLIHGSHFQVTRNRT